MESHNVPLRPWRVLLVEDNEDLRQILALALAHLAGFTIIEAADGTAGLVQAVEAAPDCIVIDAVMPGLDGFQLLRVLRGDPETATIPLIMLTALARFEQQQSGYFSGADRYLVKPVAPQELITAIREVMAISAEARARRLAKFVDGEDDAHG